MAGYLGMSVRECKERISSKEYIAWMHYFRNNHLTLTDRNDLYLMQISRDIRACLSSENPTIMEMKLPISREVRRPKTKKEYLNESRSAWLALVGLGGKGNKRKKKK